MGLFKKKQQVEERNYNTLIESLISNNIYVSKDSIIKIPTVAESIKKICGAISSLPIELIKKEEDKNIFLDDSRLYLLNTEANEYLTAYSYKYKIVEDLLLFGKHYSYIERKGSKIIGLHPIDYTSVSEKNSINSNGIIVDKTINFTLNNIPLSKNAYEVMIIDSGNKGILNSNKVLELALKYDDMVDKVIENIAMPGGLLKSSGRLTQSTIDRLRESWQNLYSGAKNSGKTVILEEGLDYKQFDIDLNKIQGTDNKQNFVDDIQKLFGLYKISNDSDFLKYTLSPIISAIESGLLSLLTYKEKENKTKFYFDTEEIVRVDEKTRVESLSLAVSNGLLTINEARAKLNENSFILDSGDDFLSVSMGKIMLKKDGTVVLPNIGSAISLDNVPTVQENTQDTKEN